LPDDRNAVACAPGRVELLGNHTDYNEGVVWGAAIDRGIKVNGCKRDDALIEIHSSEFGDVVVRELQPVKERWANYLLGVASELSKLGVQIGGFTAEVTGNLPIAVGLSSSAAIELATALFLLKLFPREISPLEIAKACQRAEHHFVGVRSGLLDQVISLFGRADRVVFFDCRSEEIRTVPFPPSLALIIARSGKKRDLASSHYNLRREQTLAATQLLGVPALRDATLARLRQSELPDLLKRRALHVIEENERVWCGVDLLQDGNSAGFGELMNASHESSRRNFENSTPELDILVSIAQRLSGVLGARLTGAGFGGAIVVLCEESEADAIATELSGHYRGATGITTSAFVCKIADGAR